MNRCIIVSSAIFSAAVVTGACNRGEKMTPGTEVQSQTAKPANTPMTVTGCIKAGEAENTYVLSSAQTEGSGETATYQLVGERTADLRDQIGRRAEVTGTVEVHQEVASRSTAQSAEARPTGTSGTPTVRTRSEIDIKRLSVTTVKGLGDKCD